MLNAFSGFGKVYDYFASNFKRDSYNNKGAAIQAVVHFGGADFMNAAWIPDREIFVFGDGNPAEHLNSFTSALDVMGHEFTHGIVSHTSELAHTDEPGALNESFADFFGKMVDPGVDWNIGSKLFMKGAPRKSIRNMANPKETDQPDNYENKRYKGEFCSMFNDYCGVHVNAGIPNKAAVLTVEKIGRPKAQAIYYKALTELMRSTSNFKDTKAQLVRACRLLYGQSDTACGAIKSAWDAVGVLDGSTAPSSPSKPSPKKKSILALR